MDFGCVLSESQKVSITLPSEFLLGL